MTLTRTIKLYALPEQTLTPGLRPIVEADCEVCCQKLNEYLTRFTLAPRFTTAEFKHWMLTQPDVVYTYVVEDPETKEITDMVLLLPYIDIDQISLVEMAWMISPSLSLSLSGKTYISFCVS